MYPGEAPGAEEATATGVAATDEEAGKAAQVDLAGMLIA